MLLSSRYLANLPLHILILIAAVILITIFLALLAIIAILLLDKHYASGKLNIKKYNRQVLFNILIAHFQSLFKSFDGAKNCQISAILCG